MTSEGSQIGHKVVRESNNEAEDLPAVWLTGESLRADSFELAGQERVHAYNSFRVARDDEEHSDRH
jgi:hypothetical protein